MEGRKGGTVEAFGHLAEEAVSWVPLCQRALEGRGTVTPAESKTEACVHATHSGLPQKTFSTDSRSNHKKYMAVFFLLHILNGRAIYLLSYKAARSL